MSNTDSRKEMRWIRYNISINEEDQVPSDIRSMKRLWSYTKLKGLHLRRDAEAKLFQKGLDETKKR
jgi:GH24 family phage-related lysozyme (muramidase)